MYVDGSLVLHVGDEATRIVLQNSYLMQVINNYEILLLNVGVWYIRRFQIGFWRIKELAFENHTSFTEDFAMWMDRKRA